MISGRKKRILIVVAILAVGLAAVAIPLCASSACVQPSSATGSMPFHMSASHAMLAAATAACDMVIAASTGLASIVPAPFSNSLLPLAVGILALLALTALLHWRPRIRAAAFARISFAPADLRGVPLLN